MVTDSDGRSGHWASFGPGSPTDSYFGLSEVIRTLAKEASASGTTVFQITKAHRNMDPGDFNSLSADDQALFRPDFQSFTFDQAGLDLNLFDEMWLFGVGGPGEASALTESELLVIAKFMDGGGGVFATGDHENLGVQLCGRIPRVQDYEEVVHRFRHHTAGAWRATYGASRARFLANRYDASGAQ